ncbi:alanine racemase [Massilia cavernae]|uniref:Amino acid deaminase n=1 Tax=Massilia cavernae TaxID=2320864 RepID=A0A418XS50_9BURK|nr:alanine racemase [Massilia cavernae]RJG15342.1 amino acid deaminase [Massilia cavernae]
MHDLIDPILDYSYKGFPHQAGTLRRSDIGTQGWNLLRGDLPLPMAIIKQLALERNIAWMQAYVRQHGIDLAPHGKTTMSPQLFQRQLDAGAWGLSFATVSQLRVGVAAGARRCILANQVYTASDLGTIAAMLGAESELTIYFLLDSLAQLQLIERWHARRPDARPFDVLLEIGIVGGRTGCRTHADAIALAGAAAASSALRLCGVECFEGPSFGSDERAESDKVAALLERVQYLASECERLGWFVQDEVIVSAGGSAVFDMVVANLKPRLARPVRALLRSGCYIVSDHAFYQGMTASLCKRIGCDDALHGALEVWASVQSLPEPGLAILAVGKRDLSFDLQMPMPLACVREPGDVPRPLSHAYTISALNDQHAFLRWDAGDDVPLLVGSMVALGISHPCTTFDKWRWMPIVDDDYNVVDAITTQF